MLAPRIRYIHRRYSSRSSVPDLLSDLKCCSSRRDLAAGKRLHDRAIESGVVFDLYVSCCLITMYGRCGSPADAKQVFDRMPCHNAVAWNALITGCVENGLEIRALEAFWMANPVDSGTFFAAIKACSSLASKEEGKLIDGTMVKLEALEQGMKIHSRARRTGFDHHVASSMIEMYGKCGRMIEARMIFDRSSCHSAISWTVLVLGYVSIGESDLALRVFGSMAAGKIEPDARCFGAAIKACSDLATRENWSEDGDGHLFVKAGSLSRAREIFRQARFGMDLFVGNALIDMFSKCGSIADARAVFDKMPCHSVVSWNTLLAGYVENDDPELAMEIFAARPDAAADALTFVAALKACIGLAAREESIGVDGRMVKPRSLETGMAVHGQAAETGVDRDEFVANTLVDFYAKCGSIEVAQRVFDRITRRSLVSWTIFILGYVESSQAEIALDLFSAMRNEGFVPDAMAIVAASKACLNLATKEIGVEIDRKLTKLRSLEKTMSIHGSMIENSDVILASTLIETYSRCGSLLDARRVFDRMRFQDELSRASMIQACADNGEEDIALELFESLISEDHPLASSSLITAAIRACIRVAASEDFGQVNGQPVKVSTLARGVVLHGQASRLRRWDFQLSSSLIEMYSKCGNLIEAENLFDKMPHRDIVLYTVLMSGYANRNDGGKVLELFTRMKLDRNCCDLDALVFVPVIKASSCVGSLELTRSIVGEVYRFGAERDDLLFNCIVDVFGKTGSMIDAQQAFEAAGTRDLIAWNAIIAGYSRQGDAEKVLEIFHQAVDDEGVQPDAVTVLCVLAVCSHAGLVSRGKRYYDEMLPRYRIAPGREHRICVVDMLGRSNRLDEAAAMVIGMGSEANVLAWRTVLAASRTWRNVEIGKFAFDALMELDETDPAAYSLMSNLFGSVGMWEEQSRVLDAAAAARIREKQQMP